ncbi:EscU/YscU/HrcU family type III secretion system export apparatus switch protein [Shewanella psychropiezotolerans]|uniref:Flagellar biosynthesis pathway, component FlhB n=2 Tax=Shewanella TaxID=22 RepID=A0A1S6HQ64_9GAMM|nr:MULTISPECIES: EscU/YscU/HrcU family type III secretion system export apparatus switch protein [Shewanella]AQS37651.1 flagellar biosynthesis pathway, component FlhB [Shewanella psychrophila]MPY23338.1 EscU/YscU/HrcU family type III secretion system export apparatus switch protein [Shewanella sp. YLB-07]QDO85428.1 EscU/YscU/HrcU family type III secretion system export apparatus switch protein [Shewanella psychropiezotolerans]
MSNESTEPKKYPPTEKKLKDLMKKGQFPKTELAEPTMELVVFTVVFIGAIYLVFQSANDWLEVMLYADISTGFGILYSVIAWGIFILFMVKLIMAAISWVLINKTVFSTESLGLKMEKISPVTGAKNIFGIEAISRSLRKVLELIFLLFLLKYVSDVGGSELNTLAQVNNTSYFIYNLMLYIGLVSMLFFVYGVSLGCIDLMVERYHFNRKNRMTFTEMKNEMKETEGSPEMKSERKRQMREVMDTPITKGRSPTFAIANPTHILVPICYDRLIDKVPVVLQISTESLALEERRRLEGLNIPILEHKGLARAFYKSMRTGEDFIPKAFYRDIAFILLELNRHKDAKTV